MARFRIEALLDEGSELYRAAVFLPAESLEPVITSKPLYDTEKAVLDDAVWVFQAAAPDQHVVVIKPEMIPAQKLH